MVTVAGLCRNLTGFATTRRSDLVVQSERSTRPVSSMTAA